MKLAFTLLILICVNFKHSYGQDIEKFPLPVLKESKVIDSLIEHFFAHLTKIRTGVYKQNRAKDDWITLTICQRNNGYFEFDIATTSTSKNLCLFINHVASFKTVNVGFFNYKGYKVFVWLTESRPELFSATTKFKYFNFLYRSKINVDDIDLVELSYNSGTYLYKKGQGFGPDSNVVY